MSSMKRERDLRGDEHARATTRAPRPAVPERPSSRNAWLRFMLPQAEDRHQADEHRERQRQRRT